MKFLIIGLGSMGKRRTRNLLALGYKVDEIFGFDFRIDRKQDAFEKYQINIVDELTDEILRSTDAIIISTPPDKHLEPLQLAIKYKKPAFVEASIMSTGLDKLNDIAKKENILIAPSCTFRFHPTIKLIKEIVQSKKYGKVCNFIYYMGQYLPDWHPWENIKDFYVGKRETSATREMVPFELTWLLDIFGFPKESFAFRGKTLDLGVDIDDTYSINLKFNDCFGNVMIDVVSRYAIRQMNLNLENASMFWDWNEKVLKVYDAIEKRWINYYEPSGKAQAGYNQNIIEEMYVDEMKEFIEAVKNKTSFKNTLDDDLKILRLLESLEADNLIT